MQNSLDNKLKVLWIIRCSHMTGKGFSEHSHEYFQIGYCLNTPVQYKVEGREYLLKPQDCYIAKPFQRHSLINTCNEEHNSIEVKFSIDDCELRQQLLLAPDVIKDCPAYIGRLLLSIWQEANSKDPYYIECINNYSEIVFYKLVNCARSPFEEIETTTFDIKDDNSYVVTQIQEYIAAHIYEKINIKRMSEELSYSPAYLGKVFQNEKNLSINEFINKVKIRKAQKMILETDASLNMISDTLGFSSVQYFCLVFKKVSGLPPGEYRMELLMNANKGISIEENFKIMEKHVIH